MRRRLLAAAVALCAFALASCAERVVTSEELSLSLATTYDQWLYTGSAGGRHRFVVRSARASAAGEVVDERAVAIPDADLPLRATMPPTAERARWVEFFSRVDAPRAVGEGMQVGRIRRSLSYVPPPYGPLVGDAAASPRAASPPPSD